MAVTKIIGGAEAIITLGAAASAPAVPVSGSICRIGPLTGISLIDEKADGTTTIDFGPGVFNVPVKGENAGGNSAVALYDALYWTDGEAFVSKKATGNFFGLALATVGSGATATVLVLKLPFFKVI